MSETKNSILPDIVEPISNAIHQNIPETEKQADGALSTVVGFFNNVVLYPVKQANLTFRYKLEAFEEDLKGENYDSMKSNSYVVKREMLHRQQGKYDFTVNITEHAAVLNDYGEQFIKICLSNGGDK